MVIVLSLIASYFVLSPQHLDRFGESSVSSVLGISNFFFLNSRIILSKMIGSLNSPIVSLVTVMGGPIRSLSSVLKNHIEKQQTQA